MQMFDHSVDMSKDIARPIFYEGSQEDPRATKENGGVPVFVTVQMVKIKIPGSRDEVDRPVENCDKTRWPKQWEQFEKGLKQQLDGVPLGEFATATAAERDTLVQMGCQTVEQVAGLGDDAVGRLRLFNLRNKAIGFLRTRRELGNTGKLLAQIEELRKEVEELKRGNTNATVPEGDAGDGLQPAEHIPVQSKPRRKKTGTTG